MPKPNLAPPRSQIPKPRPNPKSRSDNPISDLKPSSPSFPTTDVRAQNPVPAHRDVRPPTCRKLKTIIIHQPSRRPGTPPSPHPHRWGRCMDGRVIENVTKKGVRHRRSCGGAGLSLLTCPNLDLDLGKQMTPASSGPSSTSPRGCGIRPVWLPGTQTQTHPGQGPQAPDFGPPYTKRPPSSR